MLDGEYNGFEHRPTAGIEGAIDEDVVRSQPGGQLAMRLSDRTLSSAILPTIRPIRPAIRLFFAGAWILTVR
jgi:hypothetical protein